MERYIKPTYDELESYVENLQKQLADAQATVEALQAQNAEWERKCRDLCLAHGPLLIEHHDVKRDLTQLQALVRAVSDTMEPFRKSLAKLDEVDTLATRRIAEADAYYCAQRVLTTLDATTPAGGEGNE